MLCQEKRPRVGIFDQYRDFGNHLKCLQESLMQLIGRAREKVEISVSDLGISRVIVNDLYHNLIRKIFEEIPTGSISGQKLRDDFEILL